MLRYYFYLQVGLNILTVFKNRTNILSSFQSALKSSLPIKPNHCAKFIAFNTMQGNSVENFLLIFMAFHLSNNPIYLNMVFLSLTW